MELMLETIESVRPIGGAEWEIVADMHMTLYPELNRDALSLQRKFNALHSSTVPSGDPDCPDYIRRAKRAKFLIEEHSDASNLRDHHFLLSPNAVSSHPLHPNSS
jgi:hypothetical protein